MIGIIAGASFAVVFCLIASRSLWSQKTYQSKIISAKETAVKQLQENIESTKALTTSYNEFESRPENVIGGNPQGSGENDGDNAQIVLDALPSVYDYPALASSLDKLLTRQGTKLEGISGTDDEVNQQNNDGTPDPQPVDIPFQASASGNYASIQKLVDSLQRSIRPIQLESLDLIANNGELQLSINGKTFYQPEKSLTITTKEIK